MNFEKGHSYLSLTLEGKGVEGLDDESGGHRVQRIPRGERKGRVHSSTVTIACLQQTSPQQVTLKEEELSISFFSGTGPGGQNRNKVQASARIIHLPTGLVRTAQTRSRENSVRLAKTALLEDLKQLQKRNQTEKEAHLRQNQIGTGERGDKRRTYRFQDGMVQDHISGKRSRLSEVMEGHFNKVNPRLSIKK